MSQHAIKIREASDSDVATLVDFNLRMAEETEALQLRQAVVHAGVIGLMNHSEKGFYLVAEVDDQTVGSLMITTEWSDWRNGDFWWIQSVYVKPEFRRIGVYRSLYQAVKRRATAEAQICGFRLYVEKDNHRAQKTYRTMGMESTHYQLMEELVAGLEYRD